MRRAVAATGLALVCLVGAAPIAQASLAPVDADQISIDHSQPVDGAVELLVSVPAGTQPDLDSVAVTIAGTKVQATAEAAASSARVRRTAVLAIDTSLSMAGERIEAAEVAALAYIDAVPDDVEVGVVTFDDDVTTVLEPTRDRGAARSAVTDLRLQRETALYEGIAGAIAATGDAAAGQRSVLVLSDGKDSTGTSLAPTLREVKESGVLLDVVALQQTGPAASALQLLAQQGRGEVLDAAEPGALTDVFEARAEVLARQVAIVADLPDSVPGDGSADVTVSLPTDDATLATAAFLPVTPEADPEARAAAAAAEKASAQEAARAEVAAPPSRGPAISQVLAVVGVVAVGIGLLGAVLTLGGTRKAPDRESALRAQLQAYGVLGAPIASAATTEQQTRESLGDQARGVAERALAGRAGLESTIAARLEGAGSRTTPAEWVLIHAGIAVAGGVLGLLLGGGGILLLLLGVAVGLVGPWVFLGLKQARRLKAFAESLPDTLQLMSGSLSAGLSLAQSVDTIVREGAEPMSSEFRRVVVESRLGVPFEDAMTGVAQRMRSKDFEWVVMAVKIQREVGGNLAELLLTVAATLREREYLRRHVRALSAEGRLSAWVLGGLPPGFMLYLSVSNPSYVAPLFTTTLGWVMLAGAGLLMGVGVLWMVKAGKVEL
ncbi:hypothetical protein GCM10028771_07060 [Nocardioides marmoraquaticus]